MIEEFFAELIIDPVPETKELVIPALVSELDEDLPGTEEEFVR